MCLFSSPKKEAPPSPPPARAPATLDISNLEQTPSHARKQSAKGKRSVRNKKVGSTGLNVGGATGNALSIPKKTAGGA